MEVLYRVAAPSNNDRTAYRLRRDVVEIASVFHLD